MSASLVGRSLGSVSLAAELDSFAGGIRRYEGVTNGRRAEVMVLDDGFAGHELKEWQARIEKSSELTPSLIERGEIAGRPAIAERVPLGIRLSSLLDNLESERVAVSREVTLAVLRRLAEMLSLHHGAIGPHAFLIPEAVHLTLDGDVLLLRPGPRSSDPDRNARWCSSNRRMNLPPSLADDAFALMRIGEALGGEEVAAELRLPEDVRTRGAFAEWVLRLVALSDRWRVDPSAAHVARVVRLLTDRGRPLATRSARLDR
jgi:hypothetical protein